MNPHCSDETMARLLAEADLARRRRDDAGFKAILAEAIARSPARPDLRYNLACNHVLTREPERALEEFRRLAGRGPADAEALFLLAHWLRYAGADAEADAALERLAAVRPEKAADLRRIHAIVLGWLARPVEERPAELPPALPPPFLLVLGYRLEDDGSMHRILVERLEKALAIAGCFPDSPVLVSGGLPRRGGTEAEAMRRWLIERGVEESRAVCEGHSRDLVENLEHCWLIMAERDRGGTAPVLCVTSAVDVRRAGAGLEILGWNSGLSRRVSVEPSPGPAQPEFAEDGRDRLKVFRDALRCYGMPMYKPFPEVAGR